VSGRHRSRQRGHRSRFHEPLDLVELLDALDALGEDLGLDSITVVIEDGRTIHHLNGIKRDRRPDAEEAPPGSEAPSGSTPVAPGGSRDWHNRTQ
jgi:hypothetical protein